MEEENMEEEEVKDPQALLAAYKALKADIKSLRTEHDTLTKEAEGLRTAAANDEWRKRALTAEVKAAMTSQGLKDADKLMKYVSTEGLDFDEEGKLTGLDARLKELRADLPEVFDPKRRAGGKADIFADSHTETTPDPLREQVHAALSK